MGLSFNKFEVQLACQVIYSNLILIGKLRELGTNICWGTGNWRDVVSD